MCKLSMTTLRNIFGNLFFSLLLPDQTKTDGIAVESARLRSSSSTSSQPGSFDSGKKLDWI